MVLGTAKPRMIPAIEGFMGETYTALGAIQLATLCIHFEAMAESHGYGLATAIGTNGCVACMVISKRGRS